MQRKNPCNCNCNCNCNCPCNCEPVCPENEEPPVILEPEALAVCRDAAKPPLIFQLPPAEGRRKLDQIQDSPVAFYPAVISSVSFHTGKWGEIRVFVVEPEDACGHEETILYIHGAGWVFGNFHTHEKLVRELAARTGCVVIFPEYSLSPEAKFPTAIEQCYQVLCTLNRFATSRGRRLMLNRLTVAGDSVGGNMAIAMTLMAKFRGGPVIHKQLLYYPVTNACFNTDSYRRFAVNYYLYKAGMIWFWNQYTLSEGDQNQILASPMRASLADLSGLPAAMIINGEADVLQDDGTGYGARLLEAGTEVTACVLKGTIHDFVMLNVLDQTGACRAAMDLSTEWIKRKNQSD